MHLLYFTITFNSENNFRLRDFEQRITQRFHWKRKSLKITLYGYKSGFARGTGHFLFLNLLGLGSRNPSTGPRLHRPIALKCFSQNILSPSVSPQFLKVKQLELRPGSFWPLFHPSSILDPLLTPLTVAGFISLTFSGIIQTKQSHPPSGPGVTPAPSDFKA